MINHKILGVSIVDAMRAVRGDAPRVRETRRPVRTRLPCSAAPIVRAWNRHEHWSRGARASYYDQVVSVDRSSTRAPANHDGVLEAARRFGELDVE